jgi:predicted RND superfamily exporter protein
MFNRGIEKTMHKNFVPKITIWRKFIVKTKYIITPLFLIVFIVSFFLSNKCDYVFSQRFIDTNNPAVNRIAQDKIIDTFGAKNTIALLVPMGDYESEKKILEEISELPRIVTTLGLANIEIDDDHVLTDKFTPRQFSELADVDIELARLLYRAYGLSNEEYGAIFQNVDDYSAPLIKIFLFLVEQRDAGIIALTTEQNEKVDELNSTLQDALVQLEGENWSRLIFMGDVPDESEETYELLDSIRAVAQPYYDKDVVITSNPTLSLDQKNSFSNDNKKISILTVLFVMVILLFTFKSVGLPFMLILTIQGSIFINFSFPYITETNLFFLSFLIVSSIQMGATIDYAILITNRYQSLKTEMNRDAAVVEALNQRFPTIFTSGSILTIAGYLIGSMTTQPIIGSIGLALGRGTLISIILVMTALPQILNIGDVIIEKTALTIKIKKRERVNLDQMRMDGYVKGQVTGYIDGQFKGVIRGNINAEIESNAQESEDDINEK